jgi:hypothetical protein
MAIGTTRISDVIVPEVYLTYDAVDSPEKTVFVQSGIIVNNPVLNAQAGSGGDTFNLPFWKDLDSTVEANLSSSDPAVKATAQKLATAKMVGRSRFLNQWYSNADLAGEIAGADANQHVRNRFGTYWSRQFQRTVIAVSNGILADNVVTNAGDMVVDVSSEAIATQFPTTKWSRANFTSAVFTMGDAAEDIAMLAVHSAIMKQMVDADDIDFIPDSNGSLTIPTFMGKRVIVDDGMTVTAGATDGFKYTTVLFGRGAFGYGDGVPKVPVAIERDELGGNGAGIENIGERKTWCLHPFGYQSVGVPTAEGGYTLTELASAAVWTRVVDRKSVPLAFLITN